MEKSIAEEVRLIRESTRARRQAREDAVRARSQAREIEKTRRIEADKRAAALNQRLKKQKAREKLKLEKRRIEAARLQRVAINRILRKCSIAAFSARYFETLGSEDAQHKRSLQKLGFIVKIETLPDKVRDLLLVDLENLIVQKADLLKRAKLECHLFRTIHPTVDRALHALPEICSLNEAISWSRKLKCCEDELSSQHQSAESIAEEIEFLRRGTLTANDIMHEYGMYGWRGADLLRFARARLLALDRESQLDGLQNTRRALAFAMELLNGISVCYKRIENLRQSLSVRNFRKGLVVRWEVPPTAEDKYSMDYRMLHWMSGAEASTVFGTLFSYIRRNAEKSELKIKVATNDEKPTSVVFGKNKLQLPYYLGAKHVRSRLLNEDFKVLIKGNEKGYAILTVSW
jgi:hypothetical protein